MSSGFQSAVLSGPAPAIAGDFASVNPMWTYDAGPGGLIAGPEGVIAGRFAWAVPPADGDGAPTVVNNFGSGPVSGFTVRDQQGLMTQYLQGSSLVTPGGFQQTLFTGGDFWVKNDGATRALPGMKAYANFADGKATFAATGSPASAGTSTASTIAAKTATVTASLLGDLLTVTAHSGDAIVPGAILGSGVGVYPGTAIVSQVTSAEGDSALGKTGTYVVSVPEQEVASESMTFTYGLLTVGGTVAGAFRVGDRLGGAASPAAGTVIVGRGTGAGGAGTYYVNLTQTVSSGAINVTGTNVETKWIAMSAALPGELVKISSQPLG